MSIRFVLHSLKKCLLLQCNMINNASWDKNCCMPHKYQTEQNIIFTYCIFMTNLVCSIFCLLQFFLTSNYRVVYKKLPLIKRSATLPILSLPYIYICVLYRLSICYQYTKSFFRSVYILKGLYTKSPNSFILIYRPCSQYFNVVHEIVYQQ